MQLCYGLKIYVRIEGGRDDQREAERKGLREEGHQVSLQVIDVGESGELHIFVN